MMIRVLKSSVKVVRHNDGLWKKLGGSLFGAFADGEALFRVMGGSTWIRFSIVGLAGIVNDSQHGRRGPPQGFTVPHLQRTQGWALSVLITPARSGAWDTQQVLETPQPQKRLHHLL
jgi:hypothetical protein